ncbi:MAG TPA: TrkA family potassium uptake protein [Candidatus Agathobaculum intestinigallinarum]|nr:TrkA family potassium uptake protein [Candidatus Agathobaculum intestinigallinarum]
MKSFLVIGLGRFGAAVAQELSALGQEVLALDIDAENVQHISDQVTQAIQGDAQDEAVLRSVGARNFDCCVVAVGADMEASILITVMLKEMGAKYIVAKAMTPIHARVLERVGADRVVLPEIDMGQRLAQRLARTNVVDYIGVSDEFSIVEIHPPRSWVGNSLGKLGVRAKHQINVLAIRHGEGGQVDVNPQPDKVIGPDDLLIVIGTNEQVNSVVELS